MIAVWIILGSIALLALIYLYLIGTRIFKKPDMSHFKSYLYAHRGLHDNESDAPENTLVAFQKAVDADFGIEFDVHLSKDDVPVIFHDGTLERMCGVKGHVWDYTLKELKKFRILGTDQEIPTLREALEIIRDRVPILVEYKLHNVSAKVCGIANPILEEYGCDYMIESFQPMALWWYRRHRKNVVRGMLSYHFAKDGYTNPLYLILKNLLFNHSARPDFIAFHKEHINLVTVNVCKKVYKPQMAAWTIKSENELEKAREYFDMFIFDSFVPEAERETLVIGDGDVMPE